MKNLFLIIIICLTSAIFSCTDQSSDLNTELSINTKADSVAIANNPKQEFVMGEAKHLPLPIKGQPMAMTLTASLCSNPSNTQIWSAVNMVTPISSDTCPYADSYSRILFFTSDSAKARNYTMTDVVTGVTFSTGWYHVDGGRDAKVLPSYPGHSFKERFRKVCMSGDTSDWSPTYGVSFVMADAPKWCGQAIDSTSFKSNVAMSPALISFNSKVTGSGWMVVGSTNGTFPISKAIQIQKGMNNVDVLLPKGWTYFAYVYFGTKNIRIAGNVVAN